MSKILSQPIPSYKHELLNSKSWPTCRVLFNNSKKWDRAKDTGQILLFIVIFRYVKELLTKPCLRGFYSRKWAFISKFWKSLLAYAELEKSGIYGSWWFIDKKPTHARIILHICYLPNIVCDLCNSVIQRTTTSCKRFELSAGMWWSACDFPKKNFS